MIETLRSCECETEWKFTFSSYIFSQTKTFKGRNTLTTCRCNKSRGKTTPSAQVKRQVAAIGRGPSDTSHQEIASCAELRRAKSNQFEFVRLVATTNEKRVACRANKGYHKKISSMKPLLCCYICRDLSPRVLTNA